MSYRTNEILRRWITHNEAIYIEGVIINGNGRLFFNGEEARQFKSLGGGYDKLSNSVNRYIVAMLQGLIPTRSLHSIAYEMDGQSGYSMRYNCKWFKLETVCSTRDGYIYKFTPKKALKEAAQNENSI